MTFSNFLGFFFSLPELIPIVMTINGILGYRTVSRNYFHGGSFKFTSKWSLGDWLASEGIEIYVRNNFLAVSCLSWRDYLVWSLFLFRLEFSSALCLTFSQSLSFKSCMLKIVKDWSLTGFKLTIGFAVPIAIPSSWCLKVHLWMVHVCHRCHCVVIALAKLPRFSPYCGRCEDKR